MNRVLSILLIAVQLSGCATIAHRSGEPVDVRSEPAGAQAVIDCDHGVHVAGETPARLVIPRKATGCVLSLSRDGYESRTIPMRRGISGKFWAEFWIGVPAAVIAASAASGEGYEVIGAVVLFGGIALVALTAALVDLLSGRLWAHEPDDVSVKLEPAR